MHIMGYKENKWANVENAVRVAKSLAANHLPPQPAYRAQSALSAFGHPPPPAQ